MPNTLFGGGRKLSLGEKIKNEDEGGKIKRRKEKLRKIT